MFGIDIVSNKMKRIMMFLLLCTMSFTVVQAQYPIIKVIKPTGAIPTGIIFDNNSKTIGTPEGTIDREKASAKEVEKSN